MKLSLKLPQFIFLVEFLPHPVKNNLVVFKNGWQQTEMSFNFFYFIFKCAIPFCPYCSCVIIACAIFGCAFIGCAVLDKHFIFKCAIFILTSVVPLYYVPFLYVPFFPNVPLLVVPLCTEYA